MTQAEYDAFWERVAAKQAVSIGVDITGWDHFAKRSTGEDTFQWIAGPEIEAFHKRNGIKVLSCSSSDEPNVTTFFFPKDREDLAVLFKLTFA
jgi:hypothetical protein